MHEEGGSLLKKRLLGRPVSPTCVFAWQLFVEKRSLIYKIKRVGTRAHPWGTTAGMGRCGWTDKMMSLWSGEEESLERSACYQTLPKALAISRLMIKDPLPLVYKNRVRILVEKRCKVSRKLIIVSDVGG